MARIAEPSVVMHLVGVERGAPEGALHRPLLHRVWQGLPPDLLERVLLWLPALDQVRLTSVCKAWRSLISSRSFQDARTSLVGVARRPQVSILDWTREGGDDNRLRSSGFRRVTLDLSFLTPSVYRSPAMWPRAHAVHGLLCVQVEVVPGRRRSCGGGRDRERYIFCVVNLANKTWKELPPLGVDALWRHPHLSVVRADDAEFQVFAHFRGQGDLCFALYSSARGAWSPVTALQGAVVDFGLSVLTCVLCNGSLYLLAGWKKLEFMVYDAADGAMLSCYDIPIVAAAAAVHTCCDLVAQCGRVFFAGGVRNSAIRIWEFGGGGGARGEQQPWVLVASLPESGLFPHSCVHVELLNVSDADGVIYMSVRSFEANPFWTPWFDHLLAYSVAEMSWKVLMTVPAPEDGHEKGFKVVELRPFLYL